MGLFDSINSMQKTIQSSHDQWMKDRDEADRKAEAARRLREEEERRIREQAERVRATRGW